MSQAQQADSASLSSCDSGLPGSNHQVASEEKQQREVGPPESENSLRPPAGTRCLGSGHHRDQQLSFLSLQSPSTNQSQQP